MGIPKLGLQRGARRLQVRQVSVPLTQRVVQPRCPLLQLVCRLNWAMG